MKLRTFYNLLFIFLLTTTASAQNDYVLWGNGGQSLISQDTIEMQPNFKNDLNIGLQSRNLWRGLNQGESPVATFDFTTTYDDKFFIGTFNTISTNGRIDGFPNVTEVYMGANISEQFSIIYDDFYFDYPTGNYFDWNDHYPEIQIMYDDRYETLNVFVGYDIKSHALYFKGSVMFDNFTFNLGFLTNESNLNFMNKGGVTLIGLDWQKEVLKNLDVTVTTQVNPSYKHIQETNFLRQRPVNFSVGLNYQIFE